MRLSIAIVASAGLLYGCTTNAGPIGSASRLSPVASTAAAASVVPVVASLPFNGTGPPSSDLVPETQPDFGPTTGGPMRTDCTDATVTAVGRLVAGTGTVTITSRPGAPECALGGVPTDLVLVAAAGTKITAASLNPTAGLAPNPPAYGWTQIGHNAGEPSALSFKVSWNGSYCGPAPTTLTFIDSSSGGNTLPAVLTAALSASPPCATSGPAADTITAYPLGGFALPPPAWAQLRATIRENSPVDAISKGFIVRLTNPTAAPIQLQPCFQYAVAIIEQGANGPEGGGQVMAVPDCSKLPAALGPHASLDITINPFADEMPGELGVSVTDSNLEWLMPGGPTATLSYPSGALNYSWPTPSSPSNSDAAASTF